MSTSPPPPHRFPGNTWVRLKTNFLANYQTLISRINARQREGLLQSLNTSLVRLPALRLNLERMSELMGGGFTLLSILIGAVLILQIAQLPYPNAQSIPAKGITLYSSHDTQQTYALFGSKPIELGAIQLRGVVITGKTTDGKDTGFILLEIDGKATGPMGLGETAGKGMVVQAINPDGATLAYQGQKIDLTLSKTTPKKTSATSMLNAPVAPASNSNSNPPIPSTNEASKPAS